MDVVELAKKYVDSPSAASDDFDALFRWFAKVTTSNAYRDWGDENEKDTEWVEKIGVANDFCEAVELARRKKPSLFEIIDLIAINSLLKECLQGENQAKAVSAALELALNLKDFSNAVRFEESYRDADEGPPSNDAAYESVGFGNSKPKSFGGSADASIPQELNSESLFDCIPPKSVHETAAYESQDSASEKSTFGNFLQLISERDFCRKHAASSYEKVKGPLESRNPTISHYWASLRYQSDADNWVKMAWSMPGREAIQGICEAEYGPVSAEILKKLRGRLFTTTGRSLSELDELTVEEFAQLWREKMVVNQNPGVIVTPAPEAGKSRTQPLTPEEISLAMHPKDKRARKRLQELLKLFLAGNIIAADIARKMRNKGNYGFSESTISGKMKAIKERFGDRLPEELR